MSDNRRDDSADALLKLVCRELHRQAHRYLQKERVGHTLQTTALVHEAYLKLTGQKSVAWESRSHFFAMGLDVVETGDAVFDLTRFTGDSRAGRPRHISKLHS